MSTAPAPLSFWDSVAHVCTSAIAPAIHWFDGLSQNQRLLLPASLIVVVVLWNRLCPPKVKTRSTAVEDEALYTAAVQRWSATSEASKKQQRAQKRS